MQITYKKEYSKFLNREMEYKIYGHSGKACIVFPCQDGRFYDFENQGMVDVLKEFIDDGRLQLFCVDSIDKETWSLTGVDESKRIALHERWFDYICNEIVERIHEINGSYSKIMTTGCSMGALHAFNFFLRRPDLFDTIIGLSGVYHATYFFPNYKDSRIYDNSIVDYLANMPKNHPYLDLYRESKIILCIGQGRWENDGLADMYFIKECFDRLNVEAWVDFWGYDVDHDWPWWLKELPYFMSFVL